jgi:hypothetical protein
MVKLRISLAVLSIALLAQISFAEKFYDNPFIDPPESNFLKAYKKIFIKSINIKPADQLTHQKRSADQQPTGLDLSKLLKLSGQQKNFESFTKDHGYFQRDVDSLVKTKKTWALCALLDHENVDAKIYAARGLLKLADPLTTPAILAAAKQNNYSVEGSENATVHSIYRKTLKQTLEKISNKSLTPAGLKCYTQSADGKRKEIRSEDNPKHFAEDVDFKKAQEWLISASHILFPLASVQDKDTETYSIRFMPDKPFTAVVATAKDHAKLIKRGIEHDDMMMDNGAMAGINTHYAVYQQTFIISEVIAGKYNKNEITLTYTIRGKTQGLTINSLNSSYLGHTARSTYLPNVKMLLFLDAKGKLLKIGVDSPMDRHRATAAYERIIKKSPNHSALKPETSKNSNEPQ